MHLLHILVLAGLAAAAPTAPVNNVKPGLILSGSPVTMLDRYYTSDEIHANVLSNLPSQWIITSDSLHQYLKDNIGANHTIYVSDQQKWISMPSVYVKQSSPSRKRQGEEDPCYGYTNTWVAQTGSWWNSWAPASGCLYTGDSSGSGSETINWSFSISIAENTGYVRN
jgi:hypothetical protein